MQTKLNISEIAMPAASAGPAAGGAAPAAAEAEPEVRPLSALLSFPFFFSLRALCLSGSY
jgi:hypothetical protein